jgi:ribosome-binding protein aMBF1 (putative translation factor)
MSHGAPIKKKCEKCGRIVRHLYFCKVEGVKMFVCSKCVKKWGKYYPACTLSRSRNKKVMEMRNGK